jgi:FkbM family methyltransferase
MLLDFESLLKVNHLSIKGIIHAGAHYGQEYDVYEKCGVEKVIFIEPCKDALDILKPKFSGNKKVSIFDCAVGSSDTIADMNVERRNKGMSNSLLKPKHHLSQYPEIIFNETEQVKVYKIDTLAFNREEYNLLYMDIQGYELEALKGAIETLKHIDAIYTEVNRHELYEGCAMIEQLDEYLVDFDRVFIDWGGRTWGDAFYVRKKKSRDKIVDVPSRFKLNMKFNYPLDNDKIFEEWFSENVNENDLHDRYYLPVFWTSYYVNNHYGKHQESIDELQNFIDSLDKSKKYFTIVQYDDGILNDISELDIKVFGMSGKNIDYVLPLICKPHDIEFNQEKTIKANFIGKITNPVRSVIMESLKGDSNFYVLDVPHKMYNFCKIIDKSIFTLCPRGYGQTSFRIMESLQYGSIPVYISDEFLLPHEDKVKFTDYGVLVPSKYADSIKEILNDITPEQIKSKQDKIKEVFEKYYTYSGNMKLIVENLKHERSKKI